MPRNSYHCGYRKLTHYWISGAGGSGSRRLDFALQAGEAALELSQALAVGAGRDEAEAMGFAQLGEGLARQRGGTMRVARAAFVEDGQLLVGFKTFARIPEHSFP